MNFNEHTLSNRFDEETQSKVEFVIFSVIFRELFESSSFKIIVKIILNINDNEIIHKLVIIDFLLLKNELLQEIHSIHII